GGEPWRQCPFGRASLACVLEVDRRCALLVDKESPEPGNATGQRHRIVGRALLDRDLSWLELVGCRSWLGGIVGTAAGEEDSPCHQGDNQNAMARHARLIAVECVGPPYLGALLVYLSTAPAAREPKGCLTGTLSASKSRLSPFQQNQTRRKPSEVVMAT